MGFQTGPFYIIAIKSNYRKGPRSLNKMSVYFRISCDTAQTCIMCLVENPSFLACGGVFF